MLILDTNVISELMRDNPDSAVMVWLDGQPRQTVWITAITIMELHQGIQMLLPGRRRTALPEALDRLTAEMFANRVAGFGEAAAKATATIAAERKRRGRMGELRDTMIAGIALATGASLATRNTRHFDDLNVTVLNPWAAD